MLQSHNIKSLGWLRKQRRRKFTDSEVVKYFSPSRSQIRTLDYGLMKDLIVSEMGKSNDISYKKLPDEDLLAQFHDCRSLNS